MALIARLFSRRKPTPAERLLASLEQSIRYIDRHCTTGGK